MSSWLIEKFSFQKLAQEIEPSAKVVSKGYWVWTAIWVFALILTLGVLALIVPLSQWRSRAATIGPIAGYPEDWPLAKRTVVHEARHSWQYQLFGWLFFPIVSLVLSLTLGSWWFMLGSLLSLVTLASRSLRGWLGVLPFWLFYFVLPFPVKLCYFRYRLELSADRRSWKWMLRNGYTPDDVRGRAQEFGEIVAGKQYGWPWFKFWVMWGFKRAAEREIKAAAKAA